jgi:beta-1,4-mannosyl-glycoprotein beta-1,4-N-acetylglucosaminyltransferase
MRKVIDAVLYNGEADILDLRIEVLKSVVDEYWIIESNFTFTGKQKPLVFEKQSQLRQWPISKIRYFPYLSDPMRISTDPWENEFAQRNYIRELVCFCNHDDLILYSDVDEIPAPEAVTLARQCNTSEYFGFEMSTHYLKLNFRLVNPEAFALCVWTIGFFKGALEQHSADELRMGIRDSSIRARVLKKAGWHFSYMMDENLIKNKINSFSHQELNTPEVINSISIKRTLRNREDLFFRPGYEWEICSIEDLPGVVQKRQRTFSDFLVIPRYRKLAYRIANLFLK